MRKSIFFKKIIEGVRIYDASLKENFILRCHVVIWTGDMPAISKLMCMSGHNAYLGCRFCHLKGYIPKNLDMYIFHVLCQEVVVF